MEYITGLTVVFLFQPYNVYFLNLERINLLRSIIPREQTLSSFLFLKSRIEKID